MAKNNYPAARRSDVQDDYHGTLVPDPYRWLEDPESAETRAFVKAQNALTSRALDATPSRTAIEERLRALWDYPKVSPPRRRDTGAGRPRYFFLKNEGLQNQPVLYRQDSLNAEPQTVLDPNALSAGGTVALVDYAPSKDGRLLAYALSSSGSDWQEIRLLDVECGETYDDVLHWVKFTSITWTPDRTGFFYGRYPEPGAMPDAPPSTHHRLYWHALGTPQEEDALVYARPDDPDLAFDPHVTEDGNYLVLHVWRGTDTQNRFYYRPLSGRGDPSAPFVRLLDKADARYEFVGNVGTRFFFHTDLDAPRGRVIAIDVERPARDRWQEIIPEGEDAVDAVRLVNGRLVVVTAHHAVHRVHLYTLAGEAAGEIPLPAPGSIQEMSGRPQHDELFLSFQSFLHPPTVLRYDFNAQRASPWHQPAVDVDAAAYETRQVFYTSADGTKVPMFLIHKKELETDGSLPTILYGYGGFAVSLMPTFAVSWLVWLERGGVIAIPNLRGGNEYGEEWHRAGMLEMKQTVFDDFIAAAEWLIDEGITDKERLAIMGGSNGGLLVAACMIQRPDLFGAVVCRVPVADMLRYHRFSAGRYWMGEYGNAEENAEHFRFLYAYSPLHNVQPGADYPPILITTADTDDRVVPMHAKKLAATLQAANGANPVLLRVETEAGHGLGKPTGKAIEELADILAFLISCTQ